MIPFFFIGSRRSGTTLVCHIINIHPRLYTPFERYIMWILRHIHLRGTGDGLRAPPEGVFEPMWITLSQVGNAFLSFQRRGATIDHVRDAFLEAIYNCRARRETGRWRKNLKAIGEKNPPEYARPYMMDFILGGIPDARFIHVVRHPAAMVHSTTGFKERYEGIKRAVFVPRFWKHGPIACYQEWVKAELGVLEAARRAPVLTIRYEDLCRTPVKESERLYNFFGLEMDNKAATRIGGTIEACGNAKYPSTVPSDILAGIRGLEGLMERYGYK